MKLLSKEEEAAHYRATVWGGVIGGVSGIGLGVAGVAIAQRRYPTFRQLTLPLKAFLITSSGTFTGIVAADHAGRRYEAQRNVADRYYEEMQREERESAEAEMSWQDRLVQFGRRERYKIVGGSWILSMVGAFWLVGRNPYLTGQQKLVQARVYAQGLTLAVLVATAAFEIAEQRQDEELVRQGKQPHHEDEESRGQKDLWKDMVRVEEDRLKKRDAAIKKQEEEDRKSGRAHHRHHQGQKKFEEQRKKEAEEKDKKKDDDEEEEEEGDGPSPVPGKKGEGKMMKKVSDKPDKGAVP